MDKDGFLIVAGSNPAPAMRRRRKMTRRRWKCTVACGTKSDISSRVYRII